GQVMMSRVCPGCGGFGTVLVRPCPECDGDGRVRTRRTIKVRIPAGVEDGTHIQLAGEGEVGPGGGPPGDLFLEIVQRPHAIFERQGDDLHCTVTIPMVAAALGATLSVESLDGPADIDLRPGTQSGQVIPLYGQGVKHLNGNGRGDLVIHVVVLSGAEGRHAAAVRRLRPGERADVADGAGLVAECVVAGVPRDGAGGLELTVQARRQVPYPDPAITVVQAIPKGDRGELAVE